MLTGCRHVCVAWAAIGLLTLATGIAAGLGELMRVGAFALVAFGTLRLAMASDDFTAFPRWLDARRAGVAPRPAARRPCAFWHRPAPYVLLPLTGFVVLVGRALLRPPLGGDARLLILGLMVGALLLTVVYLSLLAAEGVQVGATASGNASVSPQESGAARGQSRASAEAEPGLAGLDTAQFTREVLEADQPGEDARP